MQKAYFDKAQLLADTLKERTLKSLEDELLRKKYERLQLHEKLLFLILQGSMFKLTNYIFSIFPGMGIGVGGTQEGLFLLVEGVVFFFLFLTFTKMTLKAFGENAIFIPKLVITSLKRRGWDPYRGIVTEEEMIKWINKFGFSHMFLINLFFTCGILVVFGEDGKTYIDPGDYLVRCFLMLLIGYQGGSFLGGALKVYLFREEIAMIENELERRREIATDMADLAADMDGL